MNFSMSDSGHFKSISCHSPVRVPPLISRRLIRWCERPTWNKQQLRSSWRRLRARCCLTLSVSLSAHFRLFNLKICPLRLTSCWQRSLLWKPWCWPLRPPPRTASSTLNCCRRAPVGPRLVPGATRATRAPAGLYSCKRSPHRRMQRQTRRTKRYKHTPEKDHGLLGTSFGL